MNRTKGHFASDFEFTQFFKHIFQIFYFRNLNIKKKFTEWSEPFRLTQASDLRPLHKFNPNCLSHSVWFNPRNTIIEQLLHLYKTSVIQVLHNP